MSRYVATDWHGMADVADKILEYLKPDDELYFLGDAIDRGPNGLYIMYTLLTDPRVTYLKGNHEDIMLDCVPDFIEGHFQYANHWYENGGDITWKSLEKLEDREKLWFCRKIANMQERIDIINKKGQHIILSHAGCDPWIDDEMARMMGLKYRYIWDRKHIHSSWDEFQQEKWKNTYVIHGHTPVLNKHFCGDEDVVLPEVKEVRAAHYANGHKIC